jgi:hypothetical protein
LQEDWHVGGYGIVRWPPRNENQPAKMRRWARVAPAGSGISARCAAGGSIGGDRPLAAHRLALARLAAPV